MAYDTNHLLTVGHAKAAFDTLKREIDEMEEHAWTPSIITALLACFRKVAWIDDQGQDYYNNLVIALGDGRTLSSINAVFTPGTAVIYDTDSLNSLVQYLTVTAIYGDGTSEEISDYTLSGTLATGTSTITVTYRNKTTTFSVSVVSRTLSSISAVFTPGTAVIYDTDSLNSLEQYLTVTAIYGDGTSEEISDYTLSGTLATGTSTITVTYRDKTTTFSVSVVSLRYTYSYSGGDLVKITAGNHYDDNVGFVLDMRTSKGPYRRAFYLPTGPEDAYAMSKTSTDPSTPTYDGLYEPPCYPIPVPADATSVTVTVTPSTQYVEISKVVVNKNKPSNYARITNASWVEGSATVTLDPQVVPFIGIATKYNSSGSSYTSEPTELVIEFEKD